MRNSKIRCVLYLKYFEMYEILNSQLTKPSEFPTGRIIFDDSCCLLITIVSIICLPASGKELENFVLFSIPSLRAWRFDRKKGKHIFLLRFRRFYSFSLALTTHFPHLLQAPSTISTKIYWFFIQKRSEIGVISDREKKKDFTFLKNRFFFLRQQRQRQVKVSADGIELASVYRWDEESAIWVEDWIKKKKVEDSVNETKIAIPFKCFSISAKQKQKKSFYSETEWDLQQRR